MKNTFTTEQKTAIENFCLKFNYAFHIEYGVSMDELKESDSVIYDTIKNSNIWDFILFNQICILDNKATKLETIKALDDTFKRYHQMKKALNA